MIFSAGSLYYYSSLNENIKKNNEERRQKCQHLLFMEDLCNFFLLQAPVSGVFSNFMPYIGLPLHSNFYLLYLN